MNPFYREGAELKKAKYYPDIHQRYLEEDNPNAREHFVFNVWNNSPAGIPCIYGDAANPGIPEHAQLEKARVLICTFPDLITVELIVRNALKINPRLDIVAVVSRDADAELLKNIGVSEIVQPRFEGSLEIIRHSLHRFGLTGTEIQYILTGLREGTLS